jgi:iron(III) transport system substrate-binding protein
MNRLTTQAAIVIAAISLFNYTPASAEPPRSLVDAAKKEGRLVVAGPPVQAHRETIMRFEKAYPGIKIEYMGSPPQVQEPRIGAERAAGKYLVDAHVSGVSISHFTRYIPDGWYADLREAIVDPDVRKEQNWIGGFDSGFMDTGKKYAYAFTAELAGGLFINKDLIRDAFTYPTLLDPKFAGKIATLDPRHRGPGSTALQQIIANIGEEKACQLLGTQKLILSETPKQIVDWAARGTYPVLIGADTATLNTYRATGLARNIEVVKDEKATVLSKWGNVMLMQNPPNPNAAKLFVNWMLSRDAQAAWSKSATVNSRRTDVAPGNPALAITADTWLKGYNITLQRNAEDAVIAMKIAEKCIKRE